jgi:hypothetical protein
VLGALIDVHRSLELSAAVVVTIGLALLVRETRTPGGDPR